MKKHASLALGVGLCLGLAGMSGAAEIQKRVPVRFSFESGNGNMNEDTGWKTLVPYWSQFRGYLLANSIPYGFTASAHLVYAFDPAQVYPGNGFQCRVWLEPADDPDIAELYSDYGFELGVEFRNYWVDEVTLGLSKDFRLAIQGDGPLPLGDTLLGGMDHVEFLSIPVDELLPGSGEAVKVIQGLLKVADYSNLGIGSISLGGEVVVEGNDLKVFVGDTLMTFEAYGEAHAQTAVVHVPVADYSLEDFLYPTHPVYNASLYKTIGYALTIVEPLSLSYSPSIVTRLGGMLPGGYSPPSHAWLHDGPYQRAVDGVGLEADTPWVALAFPVNHRPVMPDIVLYDIAVNPENGWGKGRAYVNEWTTIRLLFGNYGERATQADASWIARYRVDRDPDQIEWLNNCGFAPHLELGVNETTTLYAYAFFTNTGPHTIYLASGYQERKGLDNGGAPIYGLGDANTLNNMCSLTVYVQPQRGTILGRCTTNPDYPDAGVNGIPVRLTDAYGAKTTISAPSEGQEGIYRFDDVPTGAVTIEYLPNPPEREDEPDYWPMSFHFQHEGGDTDDLRSRGGMYLVQYQAFTGIVCEADSPDIRLVGARVQLGDKRFDGAVSDDHGLFGFPRFPPRGTFVLVFDHPAYAPKRIQVEMSVEETSQRRCWLGRYYDFDTDQMLDGPRVFLAPDTTPPTVELFPFDANACTGVLSYAFCGIDDGGARLPSVYRAYARTSGGSVVASTEWLDYVAPTGELNRVETSWNLASLGQGAYQLEVEVGDPAGNRATSARQPFTIDRTPPAFTVSIASGATSWQQYAAPVGVALVSPEPSAWYLELSNDGVDWSDPIRCEGTTATVREWTLVQGLIEASYTATVHARVTDAAGLSATAQDSIGVDMSGLVQLAYGLDYWHTNSVPLTIRLLAPSGDLICRVATYVDQLDLGSTPQNRYLGQEFVLTAPAFISRAKLACPQRVGQPPPLSVKLVAALSNGDPSGGAALAAWTGTAADVEISEHTYGFTYVDWPRVSLPAGRYYVLLHTDSVDPANYYRFNAGNTLYGGNGWYRYAYSAGIWQMVSNAPPGIGDANLQFSLYDREAGEMRLATDGVCDTEPWQPFTSPFPETFVVWPTQGFHSVCFEYRHPTHHEKDGLYFDSVVCDWTPPTVRGVTVSRVDAERRLLYLASDVVDDFSPVDWMLWRPAGGNWFGGSYAPELALPIEWVDSLEVFYGDRLGNATAPVAVRPAQDFLPPTVSLTVAGGAACVDTPEVALHAVSADNVGVEAVTLRERRTGQAYDPLKGGVADVVVDLPALEVPDGHGGFFKQHVDGEYVFVAQAFDDAGHASAESSAHVVLDRSPPELLSVSLTGMAGEPVTTTTQMLLRVEARDVIGPMQRRHRVNGQPWSAWLPLQNGVSQLPVSGPAGALNYVADVEVCDAAGHSAQGSAALRFNRAPGRPGCIRPGGGGRAGPAPLLVATPFADPDGDACASAEFAVFYVGEVVLRSGEIANTDRYLIPSEWLRIGMKYTWRVRYGDSYGAWSPWSAPFPLLPMADGDGDGLPDLIEDKYGTDWRVPDSDEDGILDGLEDFDLDGLVDSGESDPRVRDTDGDGLHDPEEDVDLDGERDPGETSPALADTDGDGMDDMKEQLSGTDPCDGAAYFHFSAIAPTPSPGGGLAVRWVGRAGRRYKLYRLESLAPGAPAELITNLVPAGGSAPWYATPVEVLVPADHPAAWYRVAVEP